MNLLPTDTIVYMMDFMIVPSHQYMNIFLLNHHWKESTEENPEFWLRQLAGLFYMICGSSEFDQKNSESSELVGLPSSLESSTVNKKNSKIVSIQGLNYFQFYCKFFCNKKGMHKLMHGQPVLKRIFKKIADFLQIIEQREQNEEIQDFSLIQKTFQKINSNIREDLKVKFQKEKLGMVQSNYFNYYQQFQFFAEDEYEFNREIINSKKEVIALSHFDIYWTYLLLFSQDVEEKKGLELLELFLDKGIYSKQYFIRKVATLLHQWSDVQSTCSDLINNTIPSIVGKDGSFQDKSLGLVMNLLKRYFQTSIGSNLTAKYEKGEELFSYILFDRYNSVENQLKILDSVRTTIVPTLASKGFDVKTKQLRVVYQVKDIGKLTRNPLFVPIFSYMLEYFQCDDQLIEEIFIRNSEPSTIIELYKQKRKNYSRVPSLKEFIQLGNEEFESQFEYIISLILKHYENDGKDKRQLVKDMQKSSHPFEAILFNERDVECMKFKTRYLFHYYCQFFTNEQVKQFLKKAYYNTFGNSGVDYSLQVTKFYMEEYQLSPSDCSKVGKTLNEGIFMYCNELSHAIHNYPTKWTPTKCKDFNMHPVTYYIIRNSFRGTIGDLSDFLDICGEDRVAIPLLLDWDGTTNAKDVKQPIYVDSLDKVKRFRFVLKYMTLKELITRGTRFVY